jgi:hypothetical protein
MDDPSDIAVQTIDSSLQQVALVSRLPDDLLQLLYVKQLSPSDAASSKQIKLPKNEVKGFLGDLRHKQRCMVVSAKDRQKPVTDAAGRQLHQWRVYCAKHRMNRVFTLVPQGLQVPATAQLQSTAAAVPAVTEI